MEKNSPPPMLLYVLITYLTVNFGFEYERAIIRINTDDLCSNIVDDVRQFTFVGVDDVLA